MNTLRRIIRNECDITQEEYFSLFSFALEDNKNKSTLVALLSALSAKPLNVNDVVNFVKFIELKSPKRQLSVSDRVVNIVGTGGGISTFNISTTATFVAAAAGAMVLKSGSYSYNSSCGSLDVLANLGINLNLDDAGIQSMLEELNIGFVSPKMYSPALRRIAVSVMPLALRDIGGFINTIGPLICPFKVHGQICGVRSYEFIDIFANALKALGMHNSISVWSKIGLDEFSAIGKNYFSVINNDIHNEEFDPTEYGMFHQDISELAGGSPSTNAAIMHAVLSNDKSSAAKDTVVLNAAFILLLSGKCRSKEEAIQCARDAIESKSAYRLLQRAISFSQDYAISEGA